MAAGIERTKPSLANICADCLAAISLLRESNDFGSPDILRSRFLALLSRMDNRAAQAGYSQGEIEVAKFALVAFLDETVSASDWALKDAWIENPLQLQVYDRFDAGDEFFRKLVAIRKGGAKYAGVLEVYYLCLTMGFRGKLSMRSKEERLKVVENLYRDMKRFHRYSGKLAPRGYRRDKIRKAAGKFPRWVVLSVIIALPLILFIVLNILISSELSETITVLQSAP